jgi:uncharacterized protein YbaA (DUF1428 family)
MKVPGITFTFPKMAKAKPDEEVWFSWVLYASKADRKAINKKVMDYFGEKYAEKKNFVMPFDMKRMAVGGFSIEVN